MRFVGDMSALSHFTGLIRAPLCSLFSQDLFTHPVVRCLLLPFPLYTPSLISFSFTLSCRTYMPCSCAPFTRPLSFTLQDLLSELKRVTEVPVLVAVDGLNLMYEHTDYPLEGEQRDNDNQQC